MSEGAATVPGTPSVTAALPTPSRHQPDDTRAIQAWMKHKNIQRCALYRGGAESVKGFLEGLVAGRDYL